MDGLRNARAEQRVGLATPKPRPLTVPSNHIKMYGRYIRLSGKMVPPSEHYLLLQLALVSFSLALKFPKVKLKLKVFHTSEQPPPRFTLEKKM